MPGSARSLPRCAARARQHLLEQGAKNAPHVLSFQFELVRDGRTLPRPVNYALVRIVPPAGTEIDPAKPPFIVVDPRAGHGPGIGGMKQDSEIGVALAAGHPCYFVGFLPEPMPGQTIEDVCRAEARFVEEVAARHPEAEGKPVSDRQLPGRLADHDDGGDPARTGRSDHAGRLAAVLLGRRARQEPDALSRRPAGRHLADRAGRRSRATASSTAPTSSPTSSRCNPANTYWKKAYNVYSKVDTEAARFLDFETWWGSPVLLNAGEMQWIADNLFVGNKLATGRDRAPPTACASICATSRRRSSCSAPGATTSRRRSRRWAGSSISTTTRTRSSRTARPSSTRMHQSIGHLGIFVSGKVATKEHGEFASCMEMIDVHAARPLRGGHHRGRRERPTIPSWSQGEYLFRLEARTLDDIRALGGNDAEDDAALRRGGARVGDQPGALPDRSSRRWCGAVTTEQSGRGAARTASRTGCASPMFSDSNPLMQPVKALAEQVRADAPAGRRRQSAAGDGADGLGLDHRPGWKPTARRATP